VGFFEPILHVAKANLSELVWCCLEFLTIEVSLIWHVAFSDQRFKFQSTDSHNATIDLDIPLLRAPTLLVADSHGLGNIPDLLPHFMFCPLCCQSTLNLANPHGFCCLLADYSTSFLGPDEDLDSGHLDCMRIGDN
jgi:hypothetical protein